MIADAGAHTRGEGERDGGLAFGRISRARLWVLGAAALLGAGACQLVVDLDELDDRRCLVTEKECFGRCVSRSDTATHCGTEAVCGPCILPHATAMCGGANNECLVASCTGDYKDCDAREGCETDSAHDPNHCGVCGRRCPAWPHAFPGCSAGQCEIGGCEAGWEDCNGAREDGCELEVRHSPCLRMSR